MQPSDGTEVLLEVDSLTKSYGGGRQPTTMAVEDVSLMLRRGQTMGIVGESGRVLGLMPHPERLADPLLGGSDGRPLFNGLARTLE